MKTNIRKQKINQLDKHVKTRKTNQSFAFGS